VQAGDEQAHAQQVEQQAAEPDQLDDGARRFLSLR
jgi:hypothetical protein